jgi:putative transposase
MPHYQPENGTLFITFRLQESLPVSYVKELNEYKKQVSAKITQGAYFQNIVQKKIFDYYDQMLARRPAENLNLTELRTASLIKTKLLEFNDVLYEMLCFTIMPNHVHLLLRILERVPGEPHQLSYVMKKIKGNTAIEINRLLNRQGSLWQREYYDYCVRNDKELSNIVNYIVLNPVKAKLVSEPEKWQWTWIREQ